MIIPPKKRQIPICGTVAQWARFFGWSWYQTDQMIKAAAIAPRLKGSMKLYYLSDWRRMDPELWESLRLKAILEQPEEDAA